jgi:hypothetical protein
MAGFKTKSQSVTTASQFLTFILLTSTKWWASPSASKWQMGFNSAFKLLIHTPSQSVVKGR